MEEILAKAREVVEEAEVFTVSSEQTQVQFESNRLKHVESKQTSHVVLRVIKGGRIGYATSTKLDDRRELVKKYLTAHDGPLACERIVDVLDSMLQTKPGLAKPALNRRMLGWSLANWRRFNRYIRKYLPGKHAPEEFHRHRYPGISLSELKMRISKLQQVIGDSTKLSTDQITDQIFLINQ